MGLDISHDAFTGAYPAFNRLRQAIAIAMEGRFPPHEDPSLDDTRWYCADEYAPETHPGLYEFMSHSDCDGEIDPEMCLKLAEELEKLLPELDKMERSSGHIARDGGYGAVTRRLITGCRAAAAADESLVFM